MGNKKKKRKGIEFWFFEKNHIVDKLLGELIRKKTQMTNI